MLKPLKGDCGECIQPCVILEFTAVLLEDRSTPKEETSRVRRWRPPLTRVLYVAPLEPGITLYAQGLTHPKITQGVIPCNVIVGVRVIAYMAGAQ